MIELKAGLKGSFYGVDGYRFKIGPTVFEAVEGESDGYRSCMAEVKAVDKEPKDIFFKRAISKVLVKDKTHGHYGTFDGYELIDLEDGHVWLELGTDNTDDYYPMFTFRYMAKEPKV